MIIIYYLLVALFRWDMKWILKLGVMWGVTRLFLVLLACFVLFIDGYFIYNKVTHVQGINVQLERLELCLQVAGNKPNKQLEWDLVRKIEQSEWELRKDTDEICKVANGILIDKKLDAVFFEVLGVSNASPVKDGITVTLPNGNTVEQPQDTTGKPWLNYAPAKPEQRGDNSQGKSKYSRKQLENALKQADAAGNKEDAQFLADYIRSYDVNNKGRMGRNLFAGEDLSEYLQQEGNGGGDIKASAKGKTFTFPAGTTPEQMGDAIDEYFSGQEH